MLDSDLADLYQVQTRNLNKAVQRNLDRFPPEFMFQISEAEFKELRSSSTNAGSWGGRRKLPLAFTEHGVLMLSSVLQSKRAILVSIEIMKAFVHMREIVTDHKELAGKLDLLEKNMMPNSR